MVARTTSMVMTRMGDTTRSAEDLRHAGFDVGHRFGIVFGEPPADVVEVAAQKLWQASWSRVNTTEPMLTFTVSFHGRNGFCRVIFAGFTILTMQI